MVTPVSLLVSGPRARLLLRAMGALLALALCASALPRPAEANGVPTVVELHYLEGLSNWGPTDATGEVEISFAEGYAKVRAEHLPVLDHERYQAWLVNSESNDAISVGRFNANSAGSASFDGTLPPTGDFGFDLFIITVEPEPDDVPQPHSQRSIGGRFQLVGPTPSENGAPGDVSSLPSRLPATGLPPLAEDLVRAGLLLAGMVLAVIAGMRLGRRTA